MFFYYLAFGLFILSVFAASLEVARRAIPAHHKRDYEEMLEKTRKLELELGLVEPDPEPPKAKIIAGFTEGIGGGELVEWKARTSMTLGNDWGEMPVSPIHGYGATMYDPPFLEEQSRFSDKIQIKNNRVYVDCPWCHRWVYSKIVLRGGNIHAKNIHLKCQYCRRNLKADIEYEHN